MMGINDNYTAYCFDEACTYVLRMIQEGKEPKFRKKYKSFKDFYSNFK